MFKWIRRQTVNVGHNCNIWYINTDSSVHKQSQGDCEEPLHLTVGIL